MQKVLLFFWGETFRSGGQMSAGQRSKSEDTIETQQVASSSHLRLKAYIEDNFNAHVDIAFVGYNFDDLLDDVILKTYNPVMHYFHEKLLPSEGSLLTDVSGRFKTAIKKNDYSHVLFLRFDLYIKDYFLSRLGFDNKIKFAFVDSNIRDRLDVIDLEATWPPVCHQVIQVPNQFFDILFDESLLRHNHSTVKHLLCKMQPGLTLDDIGFFIDTLHVSSTNLSWNPIFSQVGRHESKHYVDHRGCSGVIEHYFSSVLGKFVRDKSKINNMYHDLIGADCYRERL